MENHLTVLERGFLGNPEDPFAQVLITPSWRTSRTDRKKSPQWNELKDNELHGYLNYWAHAVLEYKRAIKKEGAYARTTVWYDFVYQALARVGTDLLELFRQRREQREPQRPDFAEMVRLPGRMSKKPMDSEELVTVGPNPDQEQNRGRSEKCGEAVEVPIDQWRAQAAETYGTALIRGFLKKKKRKLPEPPAFATRYKLVDQWRAQAAETYGTALIRGFLKKKKRKLPEPPAFATRYKLVGPKPTPSEGMGELAPPRSKPLGSMLQPAPTAAAAELAAGEEKPSPKSRRKPAAKPKVPPAPKPEASREAEGPPAEVAAAQEDEEERKRRRKGKQKVEEAVPEPEPEREPEPEARGAEQTEEEISAGALLQLWQEQAANDPWAEVPDEDERGDDSWMKEALGLARYPLRNRRGRAATQKPAQQAEPEDENPGGDEAGEDKGSFRYPPQGYEPPAEWVEYFPPRRRPRVEPPPPSPPAQMATALEGAASYLEMVEPSARALLAQRMRDLPAFRGDRRLERVKAPVIRTEERRVWVNGKPLTGTAILDTGAMPLLIGKKGMKQLGWGKDNIIPDAVTLGLADGKSSKPLPLTQEPVEFVFNKGTAAETSIRARTVVTQAPYDFLVGNVVLWSMGMVIDAWREQVRYRVGWRQGREHAGEAEGYFPVDYERDVGLGTLPRAFLADGSWNLPPGGGDADSWELGTGLWPVMDEEGPPSRRKRQRERGR
ncbi:hypothetical protein KFL_013740010 [Klebsormidium nitens]|uniref:Uncharacterized protein n=1 Tax=Klebsormidium nitens TaxID=105231 RepID=A0A1Y1IWE3_KLENI|nr:hypothetical protein KFL_013740010 [Klebsormidium nitens]|eukprot:GAQ93226.1 hypothetical protein KFL_013740010 [Klebsormidium nitens]